MDDQELDMLRGLKGPLDRIITFQLGDIMAAPNFLASQGLMVFTEFLGGIGTGLLGNPEKVAKPRFSAGLDLLGPAYSNNRQELWNFRNAVLHQYLPPGKPGRDYRIVKDPSFPQGFAISRDEKGREVWLLNVPAWVRDGWLAYSTVLSKLTGDAALLGKVKKVIERLPGIA